MVAQFLQEDDLITRYVCGRRPCSWSVTLPSDFTPGISSGSTSRFPNHFTSSLGAVVGPLQMVHERLESGIVHVVPHHIALIL